MKYYKIKQAYYKGYSEEILEATDDMVFLCNPKEIGNMKRDGFVHCLGITLDKTFKDGEKFGNDIILKTYDNINPIDELPIISPEEAEEKFHFSDYYIYKYTYGVYDLNFSVKPDRLFSCCKILKFNSTYNISITEVNINSWMPNCDIEVRIIDKNNIEFRNIFNIFKGYSIITKDSTLFNEAINIVLKDCKIKN
jgi:hypothetical protein